MLLDHMGWNKAGECIRTAMEKVIADKRVTVDLAGQIKGATQVGCAEFGDLVAQAL